MPRKTNDKRRILYVRDILERHIGRADAITMAETAAVGTARIICVDKTARAWKMRSVGKMLILHEEQF